MKIEDGTDTKSTKNLALKQYYSRYKGTAKNRSFEFSLTLDEFEKLTSSNCFYCGIEPHVFTIYDCSKESRYLRNGIDRIDSNLGYLKNNVVPCCYIYVI